MLSSKAEVYELGFAKDDGHVWPLPDVRQHASLPGRRFSGSGLRESEAKLVIRRFQAIRKPTIGETGSGFFYRLWNKSMIKLKNEHIETMKSHGERTYPDEGCGLLIGRTSRERKIVEEVWPTENARLDSRRTRYSIPPDELLRLECDARTRGLEVIGFFHSHPDAEARPSGYDLEYAWPWYSYIIVAVKAERAEDINSWVLKDDRPQFEREEISVG